MCSTSKCQNALSNVGAMLFTSVRRLSYQSRYAGVWYFRKCHRPPEKNFEALMAFVNIKTARFFLFTQQALAISF